jgi:hypothetical protein
MSVPSSAIMTAARMRSTPGGLRRAHVLLAVGRKLAVDAFIEFGDVLVELFETRELHLEHEAMMVLDPAFECELELEQPLTQPPFASWAIS